MMSPEPKYPLRRGTHRLFVFAMVVVLLLGSCASTNPNGGGSDTKVAMSNEAFEKTKTESKLEAEEPEFSIQSSRSTKINGRWFKSGLDDQTEDKEVEVTVGAKKEKKKQKGQEGLYRAEVEHCKGTCKRLCKADKGNSWEPACIKGVPLTFSVLLVGPWDKKPDNIHLRRNNNILSDAQLFQLKDLIPYPVSGDNPSPDEQYKKWKAEGNVHEWYRIPHGTAPFSRNGLYVLMLRRPDRQKTVIQKTSHQFLVQLDASAFEETKFKALLTEEDKESLIRENIRVIYDDGTPVPTDKRELYLSETNVESLSTPGHFRVALDWAKTTPTQLLTFGRSVKCIRDGSCPNHTEGKLIANIRLLPLEIKPLMPAAEKILADWLKGGDAKLEYFQQKDDQGGSDRHLGSIHVPLKAYPKSKMVGVIAINRASGAPAWKYLHVSLPIDSRLQIINTNLPSSGASNGSSRSIRVTKEDSLITLEVGEASSSILPAPASIMNDRLSGGKAPTTSAGGKALLPVIPEEERPRPVSPIPTTFSRPACSIRMPAVISGSDSAEWG